MDIVDSVTRSRMMAGIKGRNTQPEMIVRRFLHANGYRFRLHRRDLPGSPDIVLPRFKTCIFVHGCFWHRHEGCRYATIPRTRPDFWQAKFSANVERDARARTALAAVGWNVVTIWECELRTALGRTLDRLLETIRQHGAVIGRS
ncbi:very short patch repair endonuclease [Pseudomonas peradeniyensis]|uniref:very short patch repair endonuclease n=1 Tax=Pseudomonas peradeniyensis TaxID=2745488 RepID=UPI0021D4B2DF|nr:very short patch repair endonuclease [Pseudomonas peradeniyensis]MCU7281897.1 very short patch repair endonuclease [Pseudomonas peradeniyensis]